MFMFGFIEQIPTNVTLHQEKGVLLLQPSSKYLKHIAETGLVKVTDGLIAFDEELVLRLFCLGSLMHFIPSAIKFNICAFFVYFF